MKNQIEFTFNNDRSNEPYSSPTNWDESNGNVLTMEEPANSKRELEQLFLESQEYSFLMGKTSQVLPDYWEEDD